MAAPASILSAPLGFLKNVSVFSFPSVKLAIFPPLGAMTIFSNSTFVISNFSGSLSGFPSALLIVISETISHASTALS